MKGHYRKRGSNWSFAVSLGVDESGKRRQITRSGFKTKREAEVACAEMIAQFQRGELFKESGDTYEAYLLDFMENTVRLSVRPSTYQFHLFLAKKHILPELGQIKLKDLSPRHLQRLYAKKVDDGLSASYIRNIHAVISKSLRKAKEWGLIKENVTSLVTPPRIEKKQVQTWTLEEINQFLKAIKKRKTGNKKFYIVYVLAIFCGMRRGEILGLRWSDCDLENGLIRVQQTLVNVGGKAVMQEPKTRGAIRTIDVPEFALQELKSHYIKQKEMKLQLGQGYEDNDLVVANWTGTPVLPGDVNHDFKIACKFAGIPIIRFHDLRHTHATILLQLGENPKIVSERLGHSDVTITLNTYAHVLPSMQRDLAKNFDQAIKRAKV
ncbi:site-specific integrase [Brevibacillus borstelensis]|uniref:site-specific integrase n=1 Tax=Brevibacillus borstelensis TaxID=45462 RepID=UPI00057BCFBF|nr:site-specific integrase [Brevibacillus borstelensis]MED1881102.1 site-specific integrase [Brevibacillus borstelensis]RNB66369.1 site-specific integrase [Brevibacillus borstelensis]GED53501.1 site-specific integrase [Brevibacillus borstelensis]